MKRVLIMSDLHCGHRVGLTPPDYWYPSGVRGKWRKVQMACWNWYSKAIKDEGPFDVVVMNGDAIDGRGERSGGAELITTDRFEQVAMAVECIRLAQSKKTRTVLTRGTPYHVGQLEDFEDTIAREVGAVKIGHHEWIEVEGVTFDVKHKVGSSTVPYSRSTAIKKENVWNAFWAERDESPRGDVFIRSHVHYFDYSGDADRLCMITPALQAMGTKFGAGQCVGTVDFGFIVFEVEDGAHDWHPCLARLKATQPKKVTL
jgi:hypothetical protein